MANDLIQPSITGFAFPFRIDLATGGVQAQSDNDKLRANVVHIILTNIGERVMRRSYGAGLRQLVQDPNNQVLWTIIQHQIGKSVGLLEPRVLLQKLTVSQSGDLATVMINVRYVVRRTQAVQSLSIPVAFNAL
jgi:phage baseplate assembly protein W